MSPEPPPAGPRAGASVAIVVVIEFVLIVAALALSSMPTMSTAGGTGSNSSVVVTQVIVTSTDNACGLNGANQDGFTAGSFAFKVLLFLVPASGEAGVPYTVTNASTNSSGFSVMGTFPFTATTFSTFLQLTLSTPSSFDGPLYISFE